MLIRLGLMLLALVVATEPIGVVFARDDASRRGPKAFDCSELVNPKMKRFYEKNKTYTDPSGDSEAPWETLTPQGQDAKKRMENLLTEASRYLSKTKFAQSFLVILNTDLVFEGYYGDVNRKTSSNIHSASKSIWGAAIGIALDRGVIKSVDTSIKDLLPAYRELITGEKEQIKLRDLLKMSSGLEWKEDDTEYSFGDDDDWTSKIVNLELNGRPGREFSYNTGNSQLLSAILDEALKPSHKNSCEFIHEELLSKIGIATERWGVDPQGHFSGGHTMYLTPRELAKFGLLYLRGGMWGDKRILPEDWVAASMHQQIPAKAHTWKAPTGYGYNFWLGPLDGQNAVTAWGYGGQMIYIIRELGLVVVMTTNTVDYEYYDPEVLEKNAKSFFEDPKAYIERKRLKRFGITETSVMEKFEAVMKAYVIPAARLK